MPRREFSPSVKLEIIRRATDAAGIQRCEECQGVAVGGEIHHVKQDAMETDKSAKLTASDGLYLCRQCHKEITIAQAPVLAKVKRVEKAHLGVRTAPAKPLASAPFAKSEKSLTRQPKTPLPPRAMYRRAT